jgi:uncharacterized protein YfdQ (DUF2303 family)
MSAYPSPAAPSGSSATAERVSAKLMLETGAALGAVKPPTTPNGVPFSVIPEGWQLVGQPIKPVPEHPRATVVLRDAASLVAYTNDHKTASTRIYAALEPAAFTAVFDDFHTAAVGDASVAAQADWRAFRALFAVPASREWKLWTERDRKAMSQLQFAEFLQDNLPDVQVPDGATLLEMSLNFEAAQAGHYIASQRLQNGSHSLQWKADNNASGSVKLPETITLGIPVFENESASTVHARLRYRIKEGTLSLWYELIRPHKVVEAAFRQTWSRIAARTGVPILLGSPE